MSLSRRERALELALETQREILSDTINGSSVLRRCLTICQILDEVKKDSWINLELNGYPEHDVSLGELEKTIPNYRKIRLMYYDTYNQPIFIGNKELAEILQSYPLTNSIGELEANINGLQLYGAHADLIREKFGVPAKYALVSPVYIRRIIDSVKNRALEFINQTAIRLEFENVLSDVFEKDRGFVDSKLAGLCPEVLKNLVEVYKDLLKGNDSHQSKKIAFACRDILQDFTDAIYKPEYLPKGEKAPRKEQVKNKVRYVLMAKLKGSKIEERKLLESQTEYFDSLIEYVNKYLHGEATNEDARKCVMYTYMIIGDIMKLTEI